MEAREMRDAVVVRRVGRFSILLAGDSYHVRDEFTGLLIDADSLAGAIWTAERMQGRRV
jgi:hypothetical protein